MIQGVSFDAAGTLLVNRYQPGRFARSCAEACEITTTVDDEVPYLRLYQSRIAEFWRVNQTRDLSKVEEFWFRLTSDWLEEIGEDPRLARAVMAEGARQMYETDDWFMLYPDVQSAINHLVSLSIPSYVLSNWDMSLHRVLAANGLGSSFTVVVASLEEGVEKPDKAIFGILSQRAKQQPGVILHIGDSWKDDVEGAIQAGFHAGFVDRTVTCDPTVECIGDQLLVRGSSLNTILEAALSA